MRADTETLLTAQQRRQGMRLALIQGSLWSVGNGLTTGTLVTFLTLNLGGTAWHLGLILAVPALVGLLRMLAPLLTQRIGVKATAIGMYAIGYLLLALTPAVAIPGLFQGLSAVYFLIGLISVHQLCEYLGTVALWSWLAKFVPLRYRGRYFARRQRWQLAALIPTLLAGACFADHWPKDLYPDVEWRVLAYLIPMEIGALTLLGSIALLARMPRVPVERKPNVWRSWGQIVAPLIDSRFLRFLLYGCWLSGFNGLTQSAQNIFSYRVLKLDATDHALLRVGMQTGQMALSPWAGRFADRYGNRPTIVLSQAAISTAPLFFLFASPAHPWWIIGAYAVWSAYIGLNVCLPNLALKLSPGGSDPAYVAGYYATTSVMYALSTVLGGYILDQIRHDQFWVNGAYLDRFGFLFYFSWGVRSLGVLVALGISEPGAWSLARIARQRFSPAGEQTKNAADDIHPLDRPD